MSRAVRPLPWRIEPAPADPAAWSPLLGDALAEALERPMSDVPPALKERLLSRASASREREGRLHTVRFRRRTATPLAPGVGLRTLYTSPVPDRGRPGEPTRTCLVELAPGSRIEPGQVGDAALQREWLVLSGDLDGSTEAAGGLGPRDYHRQPPGAAATGWHSRGGALVFLRESAAAAGGGALTVRDAEAGWPQYAPGIRRRVLHAHDGQAAMLYATAPGANVPLHAHGHDEECLMVEGELFLDDVLLQRGDYQLAPAGSSHQTTFSDTGVVLFAHGDLDLRFL